MQPILETIAGNQLAWGTNETLNFFAGPDIIEDEAMVLEVAQELKSLSEKHGFGWILKCSFDKANRQSLSSFRGPGMQEGLAALGRIKSKVGCGLLTDVHETNQMEAVAEIADVIQIPAFLCRQTDLVVAAAKTGKIMHIKKGQFMAPWDMKAIVEKSRQSGNDKVLLCDRGTSFGYNRLINDMTGLIEMRKYAPVVMDMTHSTQLPGATGSSSGGRKEVAPALARAAVAVGVDGIFCETHPDPDNALCDGPTSIPLKQMDGLFAELKVFWEAHKAARKINGEG